MQCESSSPETRPCSCMRFAWMFLQVSVFVDILPPCAICTSSTHTYAHINCSRGGVCGASAVEPLWALPHVAAEDGGGHRCLPRLPSFRPKRRPLGGSPHAHSFAGVEALSFGGFHALFACVVAWWFCMRCLQGCVSVRGVALGVRGMRGGDASFHQCWLISFVSLSSGSVCTNTAFILRCL
jgi:hypothetical protein